MSLSDNGDLGDHFKSILGYEDSTAVEIDIEPDEPSGEIDNSNSGNISLSDFQKKPNLNFWILGGLAVLISLFFGFFTLNRSSGVATVATKPEAEAESLVTKPDDASIGKLKTQVALSDQEQALKAPTAPVRPVSPGMVTSHSVPPPAAASPPSSDRSRNAAVRVSREDTRTPVTAIDRSPPPLPSREPPLAVYRPVRPYRDVPPPLVLPATPKTRVRVQLKPKPLVSPKTYPVSYQFGLPKQAGAGTQTPSPSSDPGLPIPPNYRDYYPETATEGPDSPLDDVAIANPSQATPVALENYGNGSPSQGQVAPVASPVSQTPQAVPAVARSDAERRFLEGRPRTRSVSVGTQIFARIFQATAVDSTKDSKVLLRVTKPLANSKGETIVPDGALIGAKLQIGSGGVAALSPEVLYLNGRKISLPASSIVVALQDGNPLVAERIERGGDRQGGNNLLGLLVDTGATFLPMLSSGGDDSGSFRDYYQFERLKDYTQRNFGDGDRRSNRREAAPSVYYKLPANLDVQLLVVAPFELPL